MPRLRRFLSAKEFAKSDLGDLVSTTSGNRICASVRIEFKTPVNRRHLFVKQSTITINLHSAAGITKQKLIAVAIFAELQCVAG